jgi:cell fate (sporulation/competence/biofilm development) regulator YlbF (YheA/YmcA/DUF963 family)
MIKFEEIIREYKKLQSEKEELQFLNMEPTTELLRRIARLAMLILEHDLTAKLYEQKQ